VFVCVFHLVCQILCEYFFVPCFKCLREFPYLRVYVSIFVYRNFCVKMYLSIYVRLILFLVLCV